MPHLFLILMHSALLASNEEQVKRLAVIQTANATLLMPSLAVTGNAFCNYQPIRHTNF